MMRNFTKNIYNGMISVLIPLSLATGILAFDAFSYGEMVYKSYKFRGETGMIERMSEVIDRDGSLAAYQIKPIRTKDGVLTSKKQFMKLSKDEYKAIRSCYLFDDKCGKIFGIDYYLSENSLVCDELSLTTITSFNNYYFKHQNEDSIPLPKIFFKRNICGVFSSYDKSLDDCSIFEERLIKKMGLNYKETYIMTAERGSILQRLFSYEPGSEQWFRCRNIVYIVCGCVMALLILFITLRVRAK